DDQGRRARHPRSSRRDLVRADPRRTRDRLAEGDVHRKDPQRRAYLLPGLQRAGRRQRPRGFAYASRASRRQVGPQRTEDLVERAAVARELGAGSDAATRQRIAQAQIEAHVFRLIGLRSLTKAQHGHAPGPEASVTKLYWSEMDKRLQEAAVGVEGMYGALAPESALAIDDGRWQYGWMWAQAETIYAGSSEIQRNIIAERVLGLP